MKLSLFAYVLAPTESDDVDVDHRFGNSGIANGIARDLRWSYTVERSKVRNAITAGQQSQSGFRRRVCKQNRL